MSTHTLPAVPAAGNPHVLDTPRPLFQLLLLYAWAWLYLRVFLGDVTASTGAYLLTVVPVAVAACVGLLQVAAVSLRQPGMPSPLPLLGFLAAAGLVALGRGDFSSLLSAGLLALTLVWIAQSPTHLPLKTLNGLFLASIGVGTVFYFAGLSDYGVIPGQHLVGLDRGIAWRVSLFPYVPESGFFALVVILANQLLGTGRSRVVFMVVAGYFLVFSGVRSALIALILCEAYVLFARRPGGAGAGLKTALLWALIATFLLFVSAPTILLLVPGIAEGPIGSYLFREAAANLNEASITQSSYRGWLWGRHFDLFLSWPLTGMGTFEFADLNPTDALAAMGTGSESFLTSWLARVGLCFLPFVYYLVRLGDRSAALPTPFEACVFVTLWVAALAYGSFIVPYNFIFLLLFGLLMRQRAEEPPALPAEQRTRN